MAIPWNEKSWTVSRSPNVNAGAGAEGGPIRRPSQSGLILSSLDGESLFCPVPQSELPSDDELKALSVEQFCEYYKRAIEHEKRG